MLYTHPQAAGLAPGEIKKKHIEMLKLKYFIKQ